MQKPILGYGLCECGCGQRTSIATTTVSKQRRFKGQPCAYAMGHNSLRGPVRFWSHVPDHLPTDECWEWQGWRRLDGYGGFRTAAGMKMAHRETFAAANGPIPNGLWVLHKCDNPPCCNPAHLFLGTHLDNMEDMARKGRGAWQRARTVTDSEVRAMRQLHATGLITQSQLARAFVMSPTHVGCILKGTRHSNVDSEPPA